MHACCTRTNVCLISHWFSFQEPICGPPPAGGNASVTVDPAISTDTSVRTATYACNDGFARLSGSEVLECESTGTYTGEPLQCGK